MRMFGVNIWRGLWTMAGLWLQFPFPRNSRATGPKKSLHVAFTRVLRAMAIKVLLYPRRGNHVYDW
jgi:hypothetical protein